MARLAKLKFTVYTSQMDIPRVLSDASGKILWSWESKPFGETKPNEDPDQDGVALRYNQRFPGQTYDAETGLHYNFHRDYNPQTGRYVQSDPIGLEGGMNSFDYAQGSPVIALDKLGYAPTYIKDLKRNINVSIDVHYDSDIPIVNKMLTDYPNINFTVYLFVQHQGRVTASAQRGKARQIGLHVNPSKVNGVEVNQINSFYGNSTGIPASIHGAGGTRLTAAAMSLLNTKKAPFVRAGGDVGSTGGKPPVFLSFSATQNIAAFKANPSISHYYAHPNELFKAKSTLDNFNK